MTLQGQKYKLKNPNKEEKSYFDRTFGCVRKVFNKALDYAKNQYEEHGNSTNYYDWSKYLTALKKSPEYAYLKDVSAVPLVETLRVDLTNAFKNFFKSKKGKYGYPKFKKYSDLPSATFKPNAFTYNPDTQEIKLAKMQKPLRVIMHRPLPGKPKQVTLSRDSLGDYYISCLVEKAYEKLPATGNITGIDLGCRKESLVTFSDGKKIPNPKYADKFAKDIAHFQRIMARKQKPSKGSEGSGRYKKLKLQVAELKKKEARCRAHYTHNVSKQMVENYDVVSMETLRPSNMVKNKPRARSIQDANWSELQRQIEYKAERRGRKVVKIDQWFPSSKTCSKCDKYYNDEKQGTEWKAKHLDEWTCVYCGEHHDRDINAARNILKEGKKKI